MQDDHQLINVNVKFKVMLKIYKIKKEKGNKDPETLGWAKCKMGNYVPLFIQLGF
jgi:hypothetical protein